MKLSDFYAVAFDGEVFCTGCLPDGVSAEDEDASPIFADSEWDYYPVCCECGEVHDYVNLTAEGWRYETEAAGPQEGDIVTHDHRSFFQYGRLVLTVGEDEDHEAALDAYMDKEQFWPNCWFVSDHGNPHLVELGRV